MIKIEANTIKTDFGWTTKFLEPLNLTSGDSILIYYSTNGDVEVYVERKEETDEKKP